MTEGRTMAVPIRAAMPVRARDEVVAGSAFPPAMAAAANVQISADKAAHAGRSEQMRALAQKRWAKPADDAIGDFVAVPRMTAISQAVTAIAAALEPLNVEERKRAIESVLVMMGS